MTCDLISLANPGVASLQPYQPGKPVEELERELGIKNIIKLASNENPLGSSPKALQVLKNPGDLSRYPDGNGFRLKAALADYHGVKPGQITLGNGSNEILELVARALLTPAHEVVFSEHAFAVYPLVTQAVGAKAVVVPAKNYAHDPDGFSKAISENTRLVFVANPNNPTGTWLPTAELRALLAAVPTDIVVVVDEAYFDYVQEDTYPDCTRWLEEFPNLLVTRTFSKAYGLAGLRVGYGISHPQLADLLNRVRQPFNNNSLALACAEAALGDRAHIEQSVSNNRSGMQQLTTGFADLGLEYIRSAGNFICVKPGRPGREIYQTLLREGVIVRPVDNYGMPDYLRVTIGREEENKRFLLALVKILNT